MVKQSEGKLPEGKALRAEVANIWVRIQGKSRAIVLGKRLQFLERRPR
ncbi:hypothetical protein COMA1_20240 [Candidatus Nitrospira nitrosa]|uniref:Uncharacterized protein n=1 Tax=Candidatus Nitrospira nitrosa TaxID=1742972 RepID=A0A0S4LH77_9BACT|nr:hypothetical protein COMA1_20240 [Candidatus Nitrospira nitrosa]